MANDEIFDQFVHAPIREFIDDGQVDEDAIDRQIEYINTQGWFNNSDIDADDVRIAIRELAAEHIAQ